MASRNTDPHQNASSISPPSTGPIALPAENALNETDHHYGHRRVYDTAGLRADFAAAGWTVQQTGGYWLKPVSNGQLAEHWTAEMLDAFLQLGERYPESAAEIYVVAEP